MEKNLYHKAVFLTGAREARYFPPDQALEVAFAGYSNVGKSSVLNAITQRKKLARVSKTPGRTREINFFQLDDTRRLVDLPGYGFALVHREVRAAWERTLRTYIEEREGLRGVILIMDIRHPLKPFNKLMIQWLADRAIPVHVLLNKADKFSGNARKKSLMQVEQALRVIHPGISVQLFSATQVLGLAEVRRVLNQWFNLL